MDSKKGQLIVSNWFTPELMSKARSSAGEKPIFKDNVSQGYSPSASNSTGILCELNNLPLAYWDIPTLNSMVFSKKLWEKLLSDNSLMTRMRQARSFWGEANHADSPEIDFPKVSHKVTDFSFGPNNLIVGDVAVLDTPNGNILYSLMKDGEIGWSSRGWGELLSMKDDSVNQMVSEEDYMHLCWDAVAVPAVPECVSRLCQSLHQNKVDQQVMSFLKSSQASPEFKGILDFLTKETPKFFSIPRLVSGFGSAPGPQLPSEGVEEDEEDPHKLHRMRRPAKGGANDVKGSRITLRGKKVLKSVDEAEFAGEEAEEPEGSGIPEGKIVTEMGETDVENSEARDVFNDSVLSELKAKEAPQITMKDDNEIETELGSFFLEKGYLVQIDVSEGEGMFSNGGIVLDLYEDSSGDVGSAVDVVINLNEGFAEEEVPDESFEEVDESGDLEEVDESEFTEE